MISGLSISVMKDRSVSLPKAGYVARTRLFEVLTAFQKHQLLFTTQTSRLSILH
jgi:hypothetical protein